MKASDFQPAFPGRLVETTFTERDVTGGVRTTLGEAFVPLPLPPAIDRVTVVGRLHDVLERGTTQLLRLEAAVGSLPDPSVLFKALRLREAQASSRIENTVASLRDLALASVESVDAKAETIEVHRNRRAIEIGFRSKLPVSRRLMIEMHTELIAEPSKRPGQFRDIQVCIGDEHRGFSHARFVPPPPSELEACLRDWERFCNPNGLESPRRERWPYLVELAWSHYQFEAIHPFSDGNGRIGRALVHIAPVKDGFLRQPVCNLSEWVLGHREEYYERLLRVSTHGEWEAWTRFFVTAIAEQATHDLDRVARVARLYAKYMETLSERRNSILLVKLIDSLFSKQATTITLAKNLMGISYTAAQRHIEFLVSKSILKPLDDSKYGKVYLAQGILNAIRGRGED